MTDAIARKRPAGLSSGLALILFIAVYAAAMAVLLAPRDSLQADPGASVNLGN